MADYEHSWWIEDDWYDGQRHMCMLIHLDDDGWYWQYVARIYRGKCYVSSRDGGERMTAWDTLCRYDLCYDVPSCRVVMPA